jgi:uncharacterized repeat protein (TIGR02543 family)
MKQKIGGLFAVIPAVVFATSFFAAIPTFAAANIFKIQDTEYSTLTKTSEISNVSFDESKITSDVTYHVLDDVVEYRINLKNTDNKAHTIKGIKDNNNNPYVSYEYEQHENEEIEAGENLELVITATYTDKVNINGSRDSRTSTNFTIQFTDDEEDVTLGPKKGEGESENKETPVASIVEDVPAVPDSGIYSSLSEYANFSVISIVTSATFVTISVIIFKKHKKAGKVIVAGIISVAAFAITNNVKAEAVTTNTFTIETNFSMRDRLFVTWEDESSKKHNDIVDYNEYFAVKVADKDGYNFDGWVDNNGRKVDLDEPITEDIEIHQTFSPIHYSISFNGNNAESEDPTPIETLYDETVKLPSEPYTRDGYYFAGWNTEADGSGDSYADGDEVKNLTLMDNDDVTLYAQWQKKYLQIMTDELLEQELPEVGDTVVLYDRRDEEAYTVSKLADGNYWLLENLRLDPAEVSLETLKGNTNASDDSLEYLKGVKTGTTSDKYALSAVSNEWPESYDVYGIPYVKSDLKNNIAENGYAGKTGVFYNFCAASAGTYCYGDDDHIVTYHGNTHNPKESWGEPLEQEVASEDICPTGWQLPKSGRISNGSTDHSDFETLAKSYENGTDFVDLFRIPDVKHIQDGVVFGNTMFWGRNRLVNAEENYIATMLISSRTNPIYGSQSGRQMGMLVRCMKK